MTAERTEPSDEAIAAAAEVFGAILADPERAAEIARDLELLEADQAKAAAR